MGDKTLNYIDQLNEEFEPLRNQLRKKLEQQHKETGISGLDEEGNLCQFNPDGSKVILQTVDEVNADEKKHFG